MTISIPTAAKIADLGERRIRALMTEGAFKRVDSNPITIDAKSFGEWMRSRVDSLGLDAERVAAQTRKDNALARRTELEIAAREGELVESAEVVAGWQNVLMRVRTRLLQLPHQAAPLVVGEVDPHNVRETLDGFVRDVLTELSAPPEAAEREESTDVEA